MFHCHLFQGHPFMESLTENRPLLYSLFGSMAFMFALVLDVTPEINDQFEIVHFTEEVSYNIFLKLYSCRHNLFSEMTLCKHLM